MLVGRGFFPMHETENSPQRRETDAAVAHTGGAQPVLVELEPVWRNVGDTLMQARDEQSADSGVNHDEGVRISAKGHPVARAISPISKNS